MTPYLPHQTPCGCGGDWLFQHCDDCHRLFLHCGECDSTSPDPRQPGQAATLTAIAERPSCPRCVASPVRPATRSDLENRDMLPLARLAGS